MHAAYRLIQQQGLAWLLPVLLLTAVSGKLRHKGHGDPVHLRRPHRQASLRITSVKVEPYLMVKKDRVNSTSSTRHGADLYEGYIVDLVEELASLVGFSYTLHITEDGQYGNKRADGWDGVIGDVLAHKADLAAAPLFVTKPREKVVDFSRPFMNVEATVLLRKPPKGTELAIRSVGDLINQSEIQYGTLNRGVIVKAFETTNDTVSSIIWRKMERFLPSTMTRTNQEGIDRVRSERYAFIIPTNIGDYVAQMQPCDLVTVDKFLMDKTFALAMRKGGSRILQDIDLGITMLDASGVLDTLYHKWWVEKNSCKPAAAGRVYKSVSLSTGGAAHASGGIWRLTPALATICLTLVISAMAAPS